MKLFYLLFVAFVATFSSHVAAQPNVKNDKEMSEQNKLEVTMLKHTVYGKLKADKADGPKFQEAGAPNVITAQPEGELVYFARQTGTNIKGWNNNILESQLGEVKIVFASNNKIYMQNPVCFFNSYAWIAGTISSDGKTARFPVGQYLSYDETAQDGTQLFVGDYDASNFSYTKGAETEILFGLDKDKGKLELKDLTNVNKNLSVFTSGTGEWTGYGDYGTMLQELPNLAVVTPPVGLEVEDWTLAYTDENAESQTRVVKVGVTSEGEYFVQGISAQLPQAWVKGTKVEGRIEFSTGQYLGAYEDSGTTLDLFLVGYNATEKQMVEVRFWWDEEKNIIEQPNHPLLINPNRYKDEALTYMGGTKLYKGTGPVPQPELVVLPTGVETEAYNLKATNYLTKVAIDRDVVVAFNGSDVYIQGLYNKNNCTQSWIKGTIDAEGNVVFKGRQYLGTRSKVDYYAFGDISELTDLHMVYNKRKKEFTPPVNGNFITVNKGKYDYNPDLRMSDFTIKSKTPSGINDVDADANASSKAVKVIENGVLYIERGGKRYTLQGVEVRITE